MSEHGLNLYEHYDKPPFGDQDLAFQTHALQIILFESFLRANLISFCGRYKLNPYNWRRLWEGLCASTGGGSRKSPHHFQQPIAKIPLGATFLH